MRIHPAVGAGIISGIDYPYPVASLILSHHERWDGCGYPNGLAGAQIPLGARALAVAEYFDSLTTPRPYHLAVSVDTATDMLRQESGHAFDPLVVDVFLGILPQLQRAVRHLAPRPAVTWKRAQASGQRELSGNCAPKSFMSPSFARTPSRSVFSPSHRKTRKLLARARRTGRRTPV